MIIGSILKGKGTEVVSVRPEDTVLTVARTLDEHRIGAALVRDADEIMVFDGGQIVERGSFDVLVRLGGRFAELVRTQLTTAEPMAEAVKAAE